MPSLDALRQRLPTVWDGQQRRDSIPAGEVNTSTWKGSTATQALAGRLPSGRLNPAAWRASRDAYFSEQL